MLVKICILCGLCSGLKSSYVLIHIEDSGEEIQTSLQETTFLNSTVPKMAKFHCWQNNVTNIPQLDPHRGQ